MADEQPGLRMRVAQESRRISSQHRQLDVLYALVAEALVRGDRAAAGQSFTRFKDALDAHMALEDELYFPALHGLEPQLEAELVGLAADHRRFRTELGRLERSFDAAQLGEAQGALHDFAEGFAAHEQREEELTRALRDRSGIP